MSVLYLYAITDAHEPPLIPGLEGAPVAAVREGGLTAIVSDHDDLVLRADEETLWGHESVADALMADAAALPMRFGSVLANADAVRAMLRDRAGELGRALDRVRGAVELGVRIVLDEEPAETTPGGAAAARGPGTTYLLTRLDRQRRSAELAQRVGERLGALARDHILVSTPARAPHLSTAYLVDAERVDEFKAAVERLDSELGGVSLVLTGPWPPHSFSAVEDG